MTVIVENNKSEKSFSNVNKSYNEEKVIKQFAKDMLKKSLFIATFQEKRYIEKLNAYKDVIKIDNEETTFIENLLAVKYRIENSLNSKRWVGITEPHTIGAPVGYNLWVNLKKEIFGCYWFKVKTVEFKHDEICLKLEIVRPFKKEQSSNFHNNSSKLNETTDVKSCCEDAYDSLRNFNNLFQQKLYNTLTISNIKESIKFISIFIVASLTGLIQIIKYLMDYSLHFMDSTSKLITALTPIVISLFNTIMKIISGFYTVIVMLFFPKQKIIQNYNSIQTYENYDRRNYADIRGLPTPSIRPRSTVRITPID